MVAAILQAYYFGTTNPGMKQGLGHILVMLLPSYPNASIYLFRCRRQAWRIATGVGATRLKQSSELS